MKKSEQDRGVDGVMNDTNHLCSLPDGWLWTKLSEITEVIRGASPRPKGDPRFFGGDIPWIMISDVTRAKGKLISRTRDTVTKEGADRSRFLPKGTLILSNSGTVCVPKVLAVDGCIHDGFVAFPELTDQMEMLYLFYYFDHIRSRMIQENRQGVTQVNLNTTIVKSIDIPLPPLAEQQRIVAKIEELLTKLDAGVEELREAKAQSKRYRQSVLKAAVTGELTKQWREAHQAELEPASDLLERILKERRKMWEASQLNKMNAAGKPPLNHDWKNRYKQPAEPNVSVLPDVPTSWTWATVEAVSTKVVDGVHKKPNYVTTGIPFVTVKNLTAGPGISFDKLHYITEEDHIEFIKRTNPERGDLLISKDGTLGITRVVETDKVFSIFVSVALVKPVLRHMSDYLGMALASPQVQIQMVPKGSGLQHIHLEDLRLDCVPFGSLDEQEAIVREVERALSIADATEDTITRTLKQAERMRLSILKKAFDGKLVPQDPNDEPAELLLERIRIERAQREAEKSAASKPDRGPFKKKPNKRTQGVAA